MQAMMVSNLPRNSREQVLLVPVCRQRNRNSEELRNLPKVTQLEKGETHI